MQKKKIVNLVSIVLVVELLILILVLFGSLQCLKRIFLMLQLKQLVL